MVHAVKRYDATSPPAPSLRDRFRTQVREDVLNAAYDVATTEGWDRLRIGNLAYAVGVSRQTVYKEFGSKEGIGEALVLREAERLRPAISERLRRHGDDLAAGLGDAIQFVLEQDGENHLLHAIMLSARASGPNSMLPLLTTRSAPLLATAKRTLDEHLTGRRPDLDAADVALVTDAVTRLVLSHLMHPAGTPQASAARLAEFAVRYLPPAQV